MSGELVKLVPKASSNEATVNSDAVELVEGLLERLRSGESVAVALVEVYRDGGHVATAYSKSTRYHQLNSGAARLAARLAQEQ